MTEHHGSVLEPLRHASVAIATLRSGPLDEAEARTAIIQVADAAESGLRGLLREQESVDPASSSSRSADETPPETVVAELRQSDRISIELAAAFHDLLRVRRRLTAGGEVAESDPELALRVADRLEKEAGTSRVELPPPPPRLDVDAPLAEARPHTPGVRGRSYWPWVTAGALILLLATVAWLTFGSRERGTDRLEQGITLFRSGAIAAAVPHFRAYARANPDDPLPRLYLARIYRRAGRAQAASDELRAGLAVAPDDPALQRELGFLLLDVGRNEAAVRRFRSAVELDPDDPLGWMALIRALREDGRAEVANQVLARAPAEVRALIRADSP